MASEGNKKIIQKVKRLLELSARAGTPAEAATAAATAQRILADHKLSMAEVDGFRDGESILTEGIVDRGRTRVWERSLLNRMAVANDCIMIRSIGTRRDGTFIRDSASYAVLGFESDTAAVKALFPWFRSEIQRLTRKAQDAGHIDGRSQSRSFRIGCASAIGDRMVAARKAARAEGTSTALVRLDDRIDQVKASTDLPNLKTPRLKGDPAAYAAGVAAGRTVNIKPRVVDSHEAEK